MRVETEHSQRVSSFLLDSLEVELEGMIRERDPHTTENNNDALQRGVQIRALARHQRCSVQ